MKTSRWFKMGKYALLTATLLILLYQVASAAWIANGSGEWQLEIDRNGITVYSQKAPGASALKFKGVAKTDYTQSQIVAALMLDNDSLENCKEWIPVCIDLQVIDPYSNDKQGDSILWTLELLPPVFSNREYSIKTHAAQDPDTKVVTIDVIAAANKLPLDNCCVRITHMHNRWTLTPTAVGKTEIQLIQDFSMGGLFPDLLINLSNAEETFKLFDEQFSKLLEKPKYLKARFDYIEEV